MKTTTKNKPAKATAKKRFSLNCSNEEIFKQVQEHRDFLMGRNKKNDLPSTEVKSIHRPLTGSAQELLRLLKDIYTAELTIQQFLTSRLTGKNSEGVELDDKESWGIKELMSNSLNFAQLTKDVQQNIIDFLEENL